jgi:hypothetical protein
LEDFRKVDLEDAVDLYWRSGRCKRREDGKEGKVLLLVEARPPGYTDDVGIGDAE